MRHSALLALSVALNLIPASHSVFAQAFTTLDQNSEIRQVVGDGNRVYQLRGSGDIRQLSNGQWFSVDQGGSNTQMIQADRTFLYALKNSGQIYQCWKGKWNPIESRQVPVQQIRAVGGRVYALQRSGHVLKWTGSGQGWDQMDDGDSVKMICADNSENLYELKTNGTIFQLFRQNQFTKIDSGNNLQIDAGGGWLYSLQGDGHIYRKRDGSAWEMIDKGVGTKQIKAEGDNFYALKENGEIWYFHGDKWAQVQGEAPGAASIDADSGNLFIHYRTGLIQIASSGDLTRLWVRNSRNSAIYSKLNTASSQRGDTGTGGR